MELLKIGLNVVNNNFSTVVILTGLGTVLILLLKLVNNGNPMWLNLALNGSYWILSFVFWLGITKIALKTVEGQKMNINDLLNNSKFAPRKIA